ncbi:hypothetical protein BROUX41_000657 [Berkeleyomyces rouxiae]|uniref:uncharacterized protein n=1 Tax=Berkeleyomyces rouxiae TaxID=2035830 RepID=UPI003B82A684
MGDKDGAASLQTHTDPRLRMNASPDANLVSPRGLPDSLFQSGDHIHDHSHSAKYDLSPDIPQTILMPSTPKIRTTHRADAQVNSGRQRGSKEPSGDRSRWRNLKVRHNGGFLLNDMQNNVRGPNNEAYQSRSSRSADYKGKDAVGYSSSSSGLGIGISSSPTNHYSSTLSPSNKTADFQPPDFQVRRTRSAYSSRPESADTDNSASSPSLGADTAQIVDMALRINQNRRIASQRSPGQQVPPRLVPLPDTNASGTLRHHFQQQRKLSRTSSPRPERASGQQRFPSVSGKNPLVAQNGFDAAPPFESPYRYHFSQSTLSRAQKAREHLELMAHYRNLLEILPPVPTRAEAKNMIGSPHTPSTTTSLSGQSSESQKPLGRQYNPLQYIRNRKVRARERKAISGEVLGFANVTNVSEWVQKVGQHTNWGHSTTSDYGSLPPFETAEERANDTPASIKIQGSNMPRRPRLDWEMEPADMLADIYWLEKGNNKLYMQDREWRPIFPPSSFSQQPQSIESLNGVARQNTDVSLNSLAHRQAYALMDEDDHGHHHDTHDSKHGFDSDHGHSKTAKARHKLHTFKLAHKHSHSNINHHDILRRGRNSTSDDSDDEIDARFKPTRSTTPTSHSKDILEKQMREIIAREMEQQRQIQGQEQHQPQPPVAASPITPERVLDSGSKSGSRIQSRRGSLFDLSEAEDKFYKKDVEKKAPLSNQNHNRGAGTTMTSRSSLDVPRQSFDVDMSRPVTPNSDLIEASDSSRPSSPSRNPFHRVKSILRDRSKERLHEHVFERVPEEPEQMYSRTTSASDLFKSSLSRRNSNTPTHLAKEKDVLEMARSTKKHTNKADASNPSSVRGMLKSPGFRIDNVIRGGFSKLGGLIWRKDDSDSDSESSNTDHRDCLNAKNFDPLRESESHASSAYKGRNAQDGHGDSPCPVTPNQTNSNDSSSSRFDALKPPRIDIQAASPLSNRSRAPSTSSLDSVSRQSISNSVSSESKSPEPPAPLIVHIPPWVPVLSDGPIAIRPRQPKEGSLARPSSPFHSPVSRRDLARLRTLVLSSAIKARELQRMAHKPQFTFVETDALLNFNSSPRVSNTRDLLQNVCILSKETPEPLSGRCVSVVELHPLAAKTLIQVLASREAEWQSAATRFSETTAKLHSEVESVRALIAADLLQFTRRTADEADEASRGMVMSQGLKAKRAQESIEKMLRRKRRRFRWLRRGMWLGLEWVLIGIMWYVWFVVTILQIVLGVGKGVVRGVRWLFWL